MIMTHHLLALSPTDVLFFRDGRPMEGSASGHGAAWPLPNVTNAALHAALHRAEISDVHSHRSGRNGEYSETRDRKFGSLVTAGPFPLKNGEWLFPRPADASQCGSAVATHHPLKTCIAGSASSLGKKLLPVVSTRPPSKNQAESWLSLSAYESYLSGKTLPIGDHFFMDNQLFAAEHSIGIGINPDTDTQDGERFYSASYLRLRSDVQLGVISSCMDKGADGQDPALDLIATIFPNSNTETHILAGGQQRTCTVQRKTQTTLPLPLGASIDGVRVRWTLLTPAIYPRLPTSVNNPTDHPGGWLPSWIHPGSLNVQLKDPVASARGKEGRVAWRKRVAGLAPIQATLVAAMIPRALPVTGWALCKSDEASNPISGGARATHLAVPAGAAYYFDCENDTAARQLADALNWHGTSSGSEIQNRRSSLMGEKGFGLGVCSAWQPHSI